MATIQHHTGPQGLMGPPGLGITGAQGDTGLPGAQGATGAQGIQGPMGLGGYTGPQGAQGSQGSSNTGYTGVKGSDGPTGPAGPTGPTGPAGPAGPAGPRGEQGPVGCAGQMGFVGPRGPEGRMGPPGLIGHTGSTGQTGVTGDGGDTGFTGSTGSTGAIGAKGEKGERGPQGAQGVPGPQGERGAQGFGETGAQGIPGPPGKGVFKYVVGSFMTSFKTTILSINPSPMLFSSQPFTGFASAGSAFNFLGVLIMNMPANWCYPGLGNARHSHSLMFSLSTRSDVYSPIKCSPISYDLGTGGHAANAPGAIVPVSGHSIPISFTTSVPLPQLYLFVSYDTSMPATPQCIAGDAFSPFTLLGTIL